MVLAGETMKYHPAAGINIFVLKPTWYLLTDEVPQSPPKEISPRASALGRGLQMMDGDTQPFSWVYIGKK